MEKITTSSSLWFGSYCENPQGLGFETQVPGEKIVLLLRQHFITNVPWIVVALVLSVLPPFMAPFFPSLFSPLVASQITGWMPWLVWVWYLMVAGFIFAEFLWWYFNIYILTNERVVDIDFVGLLYKRVSDADLLRIQDVTYHVGGILGIFFHFGDVFIQTAAEQREFDFHLVPSPDIVAAKISEQARLEQAEPPGVVA